MNIDKEKKYQKKVSLKATVLTLFLLMSIIMMSIFGWQLFYIDKELSKASIATKIDSLAFGIEKTIQSNENIHFNTINILSTVNKIDKSSQEENFSTYIGVLKEQKSLYAIYTGYKDGSFYEIINLDIDKNLRDVYKATLEDRWLLIKIDGEKIDKREVILYDDKLNITTKRVEENSYNPTKRPWYELAISKKDIIKTSPYKFSHIDTFGITYAKELENSKNVVSIDVLVEDFRNSFAKYLDMEEMALFIFKKDGTKISSISKNEQLFDEFYTKDINLDSFTKPTIIDIKSKKYIAQIVPLQEAKNSEYIVLFGDYKKIVEPYNKETLKLLAIFLLTGLLMLPVVIYFSRIIVKPIFRLVQESKKIKNREYSSISKVDSSILEVSILSNSFLDMSKSIYEYQHTLEEKVKQRTKELDMKNEELLKLSITDKLTGLYNRVKLDKVLQESMNLSLRYGKIFSVIIMDIDFFKKINDNFGHQIGDDVLREAADILRKNIRNVDTLGRWGGEEFLVVCPETSKEGAKELALKLNMAIKLHKFSTYPNSVTISVGVASCGVMDLNYDDIISNADKALYEAKNNGRDRVEVF